LFLLVLIWIEKCPCDSTNVLWISQDEAKRILGDG